MEIPREKIISTHQYIDELRDIKHVHYRDINHVIDTTNFQICTKVDFKEPQFNKDLDVFKRWKLIRETHTIIYNFKSKTGSQYLIDDFNNVYRLSNHWGAVSSCEWTLEGRGELRMSLMISGAWELGVANLKDFVVFRRKFDLRKHIMINPEWQEKIGVIAVLVDDLDTILKDPEFPKLDYKDKVLVGNSYGRFKKELNSK